MAQLIIDATQISPSVTKCKYRGPWNTTAGKQLQIDGVIDSIAHINKTIVYHTEVVNKISVFYKLSDDNDEDYQIGGWVNRDSAKTINFRQGEYITCVRGTIGLFCHEICVTSIEITTNFNVYGPLGYHNNQLHAFEYRPVGGKIIGFHGYSGNQSVVAIGVYVKEGEPLHQQDNELVRPQEEEHLRQQLAKEARLRQQAEERLTKEAHLRLQAEEIFHKMDNENKALIRMAKEHDKFRDWIENAKSSVSYVKIMFTSFELSNLPTYDKEKDRLGGGTYGDVYKAVMDSNTEVALKILKQNTWQGEPEFDQEIATLGKIRHPNLVTLIGACREAHALVYEYLPNDNLQEKLLKSEVLSWSERTKIAASICSTLAFLHNTKPNPIVHADLKPENILFDSHNVCKLGDFGISRFLKDVTKTGTAMHKTELSKGTPAYTDPEYEKTGILTCKSDVYSFGIILLQLVTGDCSAEGLRNKVLLEIESLENFIKKDKLTQKMIFGRRFPKFSWDWPIDEAVKMTCLGIRCSEDERINRPDLEKDVWVEIVNGFVDI